MTTQIAPQLQVTTPNDTDIVLTREFDAPRHLVWKAFTTPELLLRWLGPEHSPMIECDLDLRVGGKYHFAWSVPPSSTLTSDGVFREILAPQRYTSTERMAMDGQFFPGEAINAHVFEEREGKTTVTITGRYDSKETRDAVVASGMAGGVAESYQRLDALLSSIA